MFSGCSAVSKLGSEMLRYKPNFCCNCGERIERLDWPFWSGRRFCQLCETDYWLYDIAPLLAVGVVALLGVLGFASFLRVAARADSAAVKREFVAPASASLPPQTVVNKATVETASVLSRRTAPGVPATGNPVPPVKSDAKPAVDQATFTCGAMTKKGTACTRHVKVAGERCWQHKGMPAMPPSANR